MARVTVGHENSAPVELFYEDRGTGAPIVFVHGYPLASDSWERQVTVFLNEGHRVISYDRRGSRRSSQPSCGYDWDTLACDLNVLMTTLDLRQAVLVGHSVGTGDIMRYLRLYGSSRVNRVVLIAPLGPDPRPEAKGVTGHAAGGDRYAYLSGVVHAYYGIGAHLESRVSSEVVRHGVDVSVAGSAVLASPMPSALLTDFRPDLGTIDVPLLAIFGAADRIIPFREEARRQFEILSTSKTTVVIANAPHGLLWTHADEVNAALLEFIDG